MGLQDSQTSQGSAWRVAGWGGDWGWWKDSWPRTRPELGGSAGPLAAQCSSSFGAGKAGEQWWVPRGFGGQMCSNGETCGHWRPGMFFSRCVLRPVDSLGGVEPAATENMGRGAPAPTQPTRNSSCDRSGFYCVSRESPLAKDGDTQRGLCTLIRDLN